MIRHIVLFSAKDPADVETIRDGLAILGGIPGARVFEACLNAKRDALSRDIDVVVYAEFDDFAALEAFKRHPLYQRSIEIVRPLRDQRIAVDFETTPG